MIKKTYLYLKFLGNNILYYDFKCNVYTKWRIIEYRNGRIIEYINDFYHSAFAVGLTDKSTKSPARYL
jgi:hypothetical protein